MKLKDIRNKEVKEMLIEAYEENEEIEMVDILTAEYEIACENYENSSMVSYKTQEDVFNNTSRMWNIIDEYNQAIYETDGDCIETFFSETYNQKFVYDGEEFIPYDEFTANTCTVSDEVIETIKQYINKHCLKQFDVVMSVSTPTYSQWCGRVNKYEIKICDAVGYWNGVDDIIEVLDEILKEVE